MKSLEEIQKWLRQRISQEIKAAPEAVSLQIPFENYGLDSIIIVTIVGDLEDWLNLSLDPTILWEYPTIESLSEWLVKMNASNL